jgi:hypothetical protein
LVDGCSAASWGRWDAKVHHSEQQQQPIGATTRRLRRKASSSGDAADRRLLDLDALAFRLIRATARSH